MRMTDELRHRLRLASGVVMLVYITMHMVNHALGIGSLPLAEAGLSWAIWLWQSAPGTILLYGAFTVHLTLALHTIYSRIGACRWPSGSGYGPGSACRCC